MIKNFTHTKKINVHIDKEGIYFVSFYVSNCLSTFYHKETNVRKADMFSYNDTG